ncbi:MAG: (d)CMP kinase [Acidiferrobacterales bacterium]|nr:(d)CMP kinase [Acidiferrobacterales bacterium]
MNSFSKVVTIDGPVGSGKGTVGQKLALKLGWKFLDSGALYRTCALVATDNSLDGGNPSEILEIVRSSDFRCEPRPNGEEALVFIGGMDVSERIRTPAIAQFASELAANSSIRSGLLPIQKDYLQESGLIADGRDMGTVVFPDALLKVYLDASREARVKRKCIQLKKKGICVNFEPLYEEIEQRDTRDSNRTHAPLVIPEGALVIDTSNLLPDEVVVRIVDKLNTMPERR